MGGSAGLALTTPATGVSVVSTIGFVSVPAPASKVVPLPFEIAVIGIPLSAQAKRRSKAAWISRVRSAATAAIPAGCTPTLEEVQIEVVYFHEDTPLDVDNMLKPIQDALCGVIYGDDSQLSDTHGSRRNIDESFHVRGLSSAMAAGFVSGSPFVFIRVSPAPDPAELP